MLLTLTDPRGKVLTLIGSFWQVFKYFSVITDAAMDSSDIRVGMTYKTFQEAQCAVNDFCAKHYHPIRCDKKESVGAYNRRIQEKYRIMTLADDDIFSYR